MAIRVTVTDTESGESSTAEVEDNYILVCAGTCHQDGVQVYPAKGTHVITVKGVRP
jgi:hypothetical protein